MDGKLLIKLFGDILYAKGVINLDELEHLLDLRNPQDLDAYTERILRGDFNAYRRGEHYTGFGTEGADISAVST